MYKFRVIKIILLWGNSTFLATEQQLICQHNSVFVAGPERREEVQQSGFQNGADTTTQRAAGSEEKPARNQDGVINLRDRTKLNSLRLSQIGCLQQ